MAKRIRKKTNKATQDVVPDNMLPQNILSVGERVEENKNIYISQQVYKEIHKFTQNKTTNESGGMLVGTVIEEFGKTNIVISGFVEAKYAEGTPTTLKFTHETWEYVHKEIEKKHSGKKIVGWIHTHPDFGIFLSEYDKFIHQNFFNEDYQIAYVVDPIQNIEGFYFWINGNIEKCKGFYIYDKAGVQITVETEKEEPADTPTDKSLFSIKNIIIAVLSVAVVFLIFSQISTNNKLEQLQKQQETLVTSANQSLAYMQQQISSQALETERLKELLKDEEEVPPVNTDDAVPPSTEAEGGDSSTADTNEGTESTNSSTPVEETTDNSAPFEESNNETSATENTEDQGGTVSE